LNYDQIRTVVKTQFASVLEDWDDDEIKAEKSMSDLGVSSLDLVDVLYGCMKELKVKIPWEELPALVSFNDVVQLFQRKLK
jgi:acyl carrier protein